MRKRQVKKFAKRAKQNLQPYRDAHNGGSKKLDRRRKAFGRYWTNGLATWHRQRQERARLGTLLNKLKSVTLPENRDANWEDMAAAVVLFQETVAEMEKTASA